MGQIVAARFGGLFSAVGAQVTVVGGMAHACTNLATINLSSSMGKPGDAITLTGTGFRPARRDADGRHGHGHGPRAG